MQLLFYASGNDKDKKRLETAIHFALPDRPVELFTRLVDFRERLGFIVEPNSIAILLAADHGELIEMQLFRQLLPEIYVILVIPDWKASTVKLAYLLLPRLLSQKKENFTDISEVLRKMVSTIH